MIALLLALILAAGCGGRNDGTDGGDEDGQADGSNDSSITIYDIQDPTAANHPGHNGGVYAKGVVVVSPIVAGEPDSVQPDSFYVAETAGGQYSGIWVIGKDATGLAPFVPGDLLDIRGIYKEDSSPPSFGNGMIVASQLTKVGTGTMPTPTPVNVADVNTTGALAEAYEGCLVEVQNIIVTDPDPGHGDFLVKPASGTGELLVSPKFDDNYSYDPAADDAFSKISGVLEYSYSKFRLQPRSCNDLLDDQSRPVCEPCPDAAAPVTIEQIQNPGAAGYVPTHCPVKIVGVVVTSPVFETSGEDAFFVQDPQGGPWSGVFVFAKGIDAPTLTMGDLVDIQGSTDEYNGKTEIVATVITPGGSGTVPDPAVVAPADIRTGGTQAESYEGVPIKVENVVVSRITVPGTDGFDHGDFAVGTPACPIVELIVGWNFEHSYACPPDKIPDVCTHDNRQASDGFDFIQGILDYSFDEFRIQPRTDTDLSRKENPDPDDTDGDGQANGTDNCPDDFNPCQEDGDTDGDGDACDNCPQESNPDQADSDTDDIGDLCDNCPGDPNPGQEDLDTDDIGDACDADIDGDGIDQGDGSNPCTGGTTTDCQDNCPRVPNPNQEDTDGNGIGDVCESNHLLLTEICVQPTKNEFIEIHNPGSAPVALSNYYLWDATQHSQDREYWLIAGLTGVESHDFVVRFPDETIGAGEFKTIAVSPTGDFATAYGKNPDYSVRGDGSGGTVNMEQVLVGTELGLSNGGEVVVLFFWDGTSDLVKDVDYVVWGDKNEASDKTGVTVGSSTFLPDTAVADQESLSGHQGNPDDPATWKSMQRQADLMEGNEKTTGGNGITGHDETSEDVSQTWKTDTPTPGAATQ
jgi:hypothetical protein